MTIAVQAEREPRVISTETIVIKTVDIRAFEAGEPLVYLTIAIIIDSSADPVAFFAVRIVAEILFKGRRDLGGNGPAFEFGYAV